ncbi:MAG: TetR/AcrR family transcriptional regulator [Pseudomonadota bacterium]
MPRATSDKRTRLIEAAGRLTHQRGFSKTTLADIADEAGVPLGNVYYYFKTKDEIGSAIVGERMAEFRQFVDSVRGDPPRERLLKFVELSAVQSKSVAESGCPIGSLCQELNKEQGAALSAEASQILKDILGWMREQFQSIGGGDASGHALHLLSVLQGAAIVANSFGDPKLLRRETSRLAAWIKQL